MSLEDADCLLHFQFVSTREFPRFPVS